MKNGQKTLQPPGAIYALFSLPAYLPEKEVYESPRLRRLMSQRSCKLAPVGNEIEDAVWGL